MPRRNRYHGAQMDENVRAMTLAQKNKAERTFACAATETFGSRACTATAGGNAIAAGTTHPVSPTGSDFHQPAGRQRSGLLLAQQQRVAGQAARPAGSKPGRCGSSLRPFRPARPRNPRPDRPRTDAGWMTLPSAVKRVSGMLTRGLIADDGEIVDQAWPAPDGFRSHG